MDVTSLARQLREGIGLEGDDLTNLPDVDSAAKTGAVTYLNRAYWELLDKFKFREKETNDTFVTVIGTESYAAPVPFEALKSIAIEDPNSLKHTPLNPMTADELEQLRITSSSTDAQGYPTKYYREKNQIILWPVPDAVYTIFRHYWTTLADLASGGLTAFPTQNWDEVLLFGGIWRAFIGVNGDYISAQAAKAHQISLIEGTSVNEDKEKVDMHRSGVEVIGYDETNL